MSSLSFLLTSMRRLRRRLGNQILHEPQPETSVSPSPTLYFRTMEPTSLALELRCEPLPELVTQVTTIRHDQGTVCIFHIVQKSTSRPHLGPAFYSRIRVEPDARPISPTPQYDGPAPIAALSAVDSRQSDEPLDGQGQHDDQCHLHGRGRRDDELAAGEPQIAKKNVRRLHGLPIDEAGRRSASGVTGRGVGIVRQQYSHPPPVALAQHAIDLFKAMSAELDADCLCLREQRALSLHRGA